MSVSSHPPEPASHSLFRGLAPLFVVVLFGFLSIGIPLAPLALELHDVRAWSSIVVGIAIGAQSLSTVASRHRAGLVSDHHGPRRAVLLGLPLAALSSMIYLAAAAGWLSAVPSLILFLAGRVLLGIGESLFATGAMSWGIARVGAPRTGKVMAWQGIAMYAAIAIGAPIGLWLRQRYGFTAVCFTSAAALLVAAAIAAALTRVAPVAAERARFVDVVRLIARPGAVLALATSPFALISAFVPLLYASRGWAGAGAAILAFGGSYILVRLLFVDTIDRFGARRVVMLSLIVEALGQAVLAVGTHAWITMLGALVTGFGFSLIFPAMGVEATKRLPPTQRGQAVGGFIAFFDIAMGVAAPVGGVIASVFGYQSVFVAGALFALTAWYVSRWIGRAVPLAR